MINKNNIYNLMINKFNNMQKEKNLHFLFKF